MSLAAIIAVRRSLQIQSLTVEGPVIVCRAISTARGASCPQCGQGSTRMHSRYTRRFRDPPWRQTPVWLVVQVRRFFCDTPGCPQHIFAERLPWASPYARRTTAFTTWVAQVGWTHSAEVAARLAPAAGYPVSPDTVLRLLRQQPEPERATPRVLGVDDWALRKGHRYGTVVVDLETHRIVDVLPDRRAETLAAWLAAHPGVAVVSRDRSGAYAQGIATGAPEAQQVADRWHLLQNLATAVDAWLASWRPPAGEADSSSAAPEPPAPDASAASTPGSPAGARRRARWEAIHRLRAAGATVRAIARKLGLDRATVRAYLAQATPPPDRHPPAYGAGWRPGSLGWRCGTRRGPAPAKPSGNAPGQRAFRAVGRRSTPGCSVSIRRRAAKPASRLLRQRR